VSTRLDLLAIAAHRDDVEQTCGGVLIRMAEKGYRTGSLELAAGEMGTRGDAATRECEAEAAGREMLLAWRGNLGLPDARLELTLEAKLAVAAKLRELRPATVILPYWEGRHPDHYTASTLGYEACYAAGLKQLPVSGEPHRPKKILYASMYWETKPSFLVDISAHHKQKLDAINCFASQFAGDLKNVTELYPAWGRLLDRVTTQCKYYGHLMGVDFAEPFIVKEVMAVDDIVDLPVVSI